ncbi:hypothetical protein [Microcoleus vaginatus]|uniref:hypothetical protein n=1 Tax=Microcoleus vaginatus TaxID=119532 RepID=UPI00403F3D4F
MPVPQEMNFIVEQAGKPVPKQVINNGATSQVDRTSANFSAPVVSKTIACLAAGNNRRKIWRYPSASPRRWNLATTNRCIFGNCRTIHQG